jgi:hypothetical protein
MSLIYRTFIKHLILINFKLMNPVLWTDYIGAGLQPSQKHEWHVHLVRIVASCVFVCTTHAFLWWYAQVRHSIFFVTVRVGTAYQHLS